MAKSFYQEVEHHFKRDVVHGWALANIYFLQFYVLILMLNFRSKYQGEEKVRSFNPSKNTKKKPQRKKILPKHPQVHFQTKS